MGDEDGGGNDGLPPPPPPPPGATDDQSPDTPLVIAGADGRPVDPNGATQVLKKAPDKIDVGTLQTLLLTLTAAVTALTADVASLKNTHPSASGDAFKAANTGGITSTVKQLIFGPGTTLGTPTPDDRREARDAIASLELPDKCKDLVLKSKVPRCKDKANRRGWIRQFKQFVRCAHSYSWIIMVGSYDPADQRYLLANFVLYALLVSALAGATWAETYFDNVKDGDGATVWIKFSRDYMDLQPAARLRHKKRLMNIKQGAAESVVAYGKRALRIIDTLATLDCTVPDEDASLAWLGGLRSEYDVVKQILEACGLIREGSLPALTVTIERFRHSKRADTCQHLTK